jgi:hypothetical protein
VHTNKESALREVASLEDPDIKCLDCDVSGAISEEVFLLCVKYERKGEPYKMEIAGIYGMHEFANAAAQELRDKEDKDLDRGWEFYGYTDDYSFWGRRTEKGDLFEKDCEICVFVLPKSVTE